MYTMRPAEFAYHRPASLDEAIALLGDEETRALAGGHSLLPMMKLRLATPAALVDLAGIPGLGEISGDTIGALVTHAAVAESGHPLLAEAAAQIGDRQVRNRGTIGGSVAHADPSADYPTVLKALGATINVKGKNGERQIAADDFFLGIFTTALEPGELVTSVTVPALGPGTGAAYVKHRHPASSYAVVGIAAIVTIEGGSVTSARLTIGGLTAPPVHATAAVEALEGGATIGAAAEKVTEAISNAIGDGYASGEYRIHLATVLAGRALTRAAARAG